MPIDEIVVLASSKKWGGRCVAGISTQSDRWLRPVSRSAHGALSPYHHRIDGHEVAPLDVVRFEHDGGLDDPAQPENVAVGASRWELTGRLDSAGREAFLASHSVAGPVLLGNRGGAVPEEEALRGVQASLALVCPQVVEFRLDPPRNGVGRLRPRVDFRLDGRDYDLAITDYLVAPRLMRVGLGAHQTADLGLPPASDVYLTISLAELRDGWCTKLAAAALFVPEEA